MNSTSDSKTKTLLVYYISATIATIAYKLMSCQTVSQGGHDRLFYHPYMQTLTMFLGEALCLIIFHMNTQKNVLILQEGKAPHSFTIFIIPALVDCLSSILQYIALNFISGSSYRMFQGASIVTTAVFSKLLFGMIIEKRHITGCGLAFIGLIIVGSSGFIESKADDGSIGTQLLGYILMLISLIFMGYHIAYQQKLMIKHSINPLEMVGWEGCYGLVLIIIISLLFSIIPCNLGQDLCVYDSYGHQFFQRADIFFIQMGQDWVVFLLIMISIASISVTNKNGVAITKLFDGLTFCLVSMSKTPVIWAIGLAITFSTAQDSNYQLQSKNLVVNIMKVIGFVLIIIGTLIYNKLIFKRLFADKVEILQKNEINQITQELII